MEIWKDCEFDTRYKISNMGNIKRTLCNGTDRILKRSVLNKGKTHPYYYIQIHKEGKRINYLIHRLVAKAFCENHSDINNICDHIDRNTLNNEVSNLRWGSQKDNMKNTSKYKTHILETDFKKRKAILDKEYSLDKKQSGIYTCKLCDLNFESIYQQTKHINSKNHKLKQLCCDEIGEKFNKQNYLIWRNNRYPNNGYKDFV
tara:strand:- start:230 stop:835 length:606 start_codon:yes stop_codon:yes gene_type:complete